MATQRINFGEWMPDQPGLSGALVEAKNIVSQAVGYGPLNTSVVFSDEAGENLKTLVTGKTPAGITKLFAASDSKIYEVSSIGALTDISKSGGYSGSERFRFTQFGNTIIGTNYDDVLQSYVLGTSTQFDDLSATAPVAKYLTVVRDFVVAGFINESPTVHPYRVKWSAINDETDWTVNVNTQSDYQDIPDGGQIVGIRGGEFGLIFLEKSISRMSYVGTPFIFQFDNISRNKGCSAAGSIAQVQGICFFLSEDGFYMCDGQQIQAIGSEKIDRWFYNIADESAFDTMSASVDPVRKLVIWNFATVNANREVLIYNFKTQKWTHGETTTDYISDASTGSVTLEQLDDISASIDGLPASLDSILWIGGKYFLGGTTGKHVVTFNGPPASASIITGDIDSGGRSIVTLARPQVDNGSADVSVASRTLLNQEINFTTAIPADSENRVSLRSNGRYHRLEINPTGDNWKTAIAVDVDIIGQGGR